MAFWGGEVGSQSRIADLLESEHVKRETNAPTQHIGELANKPQTDVESGDAQRRGGGGGGEKRVRRHGERREMRKGARRERGSEGSEHAMQGREVFTEVDRGRECVRLPSAPGGRAWTSGTATATSLGWRGERLWAVQVRQRWTWAR